MLRKNLIAEFDREAAKTRKMLDAIPADADFNYKPHPKSMSLGRLAGHLTDFAGDWAHDDADEGQAGVPGGPQVGSVCAGEQSGGAGEVRQAIWRETHAALVATTGEKWDRKWQFVFGGQAWIDEPKHQVFREMVLNHMIHHRAQLSVYLRLLGAKVPGMYGPSADEM